MKVFIKKYFGALALTFVFISSAFSQAGVQLTTDLQQHNITLGDQVLLSYELKQENSDELVQVNFPYFERQLTEKIEVVNSSFDTLESEDGYEVIKYNLLITCFEEGNQYIPAFPFVLEHEGVTDTLYSKETYLEVGGVALDTTNAIRDIKPLEKAPLTAREVLPWFLILILIGVIIGLIALYFDKKRKQEPGEEAEEKPKEPADVIALRELDLLRAQKLWQQKQVKEYYTRLTGTFRKYIEYHFEIPALEQTTSEILTEFHQSDFRSKINYQEMEELLNLADLVKFAKGEPNPEENEKLLDVAYKFVRDTKDIYKENNNETDTNN